VEVVGTLFTVAIDDAAVTVSVERGKVLVHGSTSTQAVAATEHLVLTRLSSAALKPIQRQPHRSQPSARRLPALRPTHSMRRQAFRRAGAGAGRRSAGRRSSSLAAQRLERWLASKPARCRLGSGLL